MSKSAWALKILLFGMLAAIQTEALLKLKLYPEEQVLAERCMEECKLKECPKTFYQMKDPETKEFSCEPNCIAFFDCNDLSYILGQWQKDRKEIYKAGIRDNDNYKTICNAYCDKVTGNEPQKRAVGVASVKMTKSECIVRCKAGSYMHSE